MYGTCVFGRNISVLLTHKRRYQGFLKEVERHRNIIEPLLQTKKYQIEKVHNHAIIMIYNKRAANLFEAIEQGKHVDIDYKLAVFVRLTQHQHLTTPILYEKFNDVCVKLGYTDDFIRKFLQIEEKEIKDLILDTKE